MFHPRLGASPEKGPSGLTGDPLVRFELLSLLLNANLEYELTFFALSGR